MAVHRRLPSSLSPDLRDRLDNLPFTWPLRQARGEVTACTTIEPCPADWQQRFEDQYGDGSYADNRSTLFDWVGRLDAQGADLEVVITALTRVRRTERTHLLEMRARPLLRHFDTRRARIRRDVVELYRALDPDGLITDAHATAVIDRDPLLNPDNRVFPAGDQRLERTGPPARPWVDEARAELKAAGVPERGQQELLIAVGLIHTRRLRQRT